METVARPDPEGQGLENFHMALETWRALSQPTLDADNLHQAIDIESSRSTIRARVLRAWWETNPLRGDSPADSLRPEDALDRIAPALALVRSATVDARESEFGGGSPGANAFDIFYSLENLLLVSTGMSRSRSRRICDQALQLRPDYRFVSPRIGWMPPFDYLTDSASLAYLMAPPVHGYLHQYPFPDRDVGEDLEGLASDVRGMWREARRLQALEIVAAVDAVASVLLVAMPDIADVLIQVSPLLAAAAAQNIEDFVATLAGLQF